MGQVRQYLTIKILHNDMTVMVPCENAGKAATAACIAPLDNPLHESRMYAMMHIAIHDAVNAIDRRSRPYTFDVPVQPGASADAAVAAAAIPKHICVDAGHGGGDPGGRSLGTPESRLVLPYALELAQVLRGRGHTVTLTRRGPDRDADGRLLRYMDRDGVDIGKTLIQQGWANASDEPNPRRAIYRRIDGRSPDICG